MKEKRILFITGVIMLFFMSVGLSYSYFTTAVSGNENAKDMVVEAGTLKLEYTDGPEITVKNIKPGWTITKTVTVKNTGTLDAIYNLKWKELTNTITSDELVFDLNCESSTDTCSYINLENQVVPSSPDLIMGDIIIYPGEIQTLSLTFTFKELNKDQNYNQGKKFNGVLNIEETTTTNDNEYTMLAQVINTNNEPIANTTIELQNESKTGTTDDSGYVMIDAIKPGSHTVLVKNSSGNVLDTRRVSIQQKKESDVIDSKVIYADITLPQFTTTIVLNESNKIEEMSNLITPPDDCFTVSDGKIKKYNPNNNVNCPLELIIPSEVNGNVITSISKLMSGCSSYAGAFESLNLRKIIIPSTVTTIEDFAFRENQLTSITIPNSVTTIGQSAFRENQLTSVIVPNSITSIGSSAFNNNQLPDNQAFIYKRNGDGSEDETTIVSYGGANKNPVIPNNVTTISGGSFATNQLTSVTIPDNVTTIGAWAFGNNQLTSITIPNGITTIEDNVFHSNKLTSVIIPEGITKIGYSAFGDNQLTSVTIPDSVTFIGLYAFQYNKLKSIVIPKNVTTIYGASFANNQLTTVTIPEGVTTIRTNAFNYNQITSITIPKSVTSIEQSAFANNNFKIIKIKSKTKNSEFSTYSPNWGWADDVSCVKDNTENVENGCITWGAE